MFMGQWNLKKGFSAGDVSEDEKDHNSICDWWDFNMIRYGPKIAQEMIIMCGWKCSIALLMTQL
jgi:hypothetical protein